MHGQFMRFEFVTMVPIDLDGIDTQYMTEKDVELLNNYHKEVYEKKMCIRDRSNNTLVHFKGDASLIGTLQNVYLDECRGFYYMGTPVENS